MNLPIAYYLRLARGGGPQHLTDLMEGQPPTSEEAIDADVHTEMGGREYICKGSRVFPPNHTYWLKPTSGTP